jgi:hypothetical protein
MKLNLHASRIPDFNIQVSAELWSEIYYLAEIASPREVGVLIEVEGNAIDFTLGKMFLLKQTITGTSVDAEPEHVAEVISAHPKPQLLWGWVHSHVRMGCFWSERDDKNIRNILSVAGRCLSIVVSLDGSYKARYDQEIPGAILGEPIRLVVEDIPVRVAPILSLERRHQLDEELKASIVVPALVEIDKRYYSEAGRTMVEAMDMKMLGKVCLTCRFWEPEAGLCGLDIAQAQLDPDGGCCGRWRERGTSNLLRARVKLSKKQMVCAYCAHFDFVEGENICHVKDYYTRTPGNHPNPTKSLCSDFSPRLKA